jgi:uncharacterized repeat protein (TIGR01451 family)
VGREIGSMRSMANLAWSSKPLKEAFQNNWRMAGFAFALLAVVVLVGRSVQPAAAQGTADLEITKEFANRNTVRVGENITYLITVTNLGPDTATGVFFGEALPDELNPVSATCSQGTSLVTGCYVESLPSGDSVTATVVVQAIPNSKKERRVFNSAQIFSSDTYDPNMSNNNARVETKFIGPT